MTPTERFNACMKITELTMQRRRSREEYEWRFTIAFWALIAAAVQFFHVNYILGFGLGLRASVAIIILILYTIFWLRGVHSAHRQDFNRGTHFLREAEKILSQNEIEKFAEPTVPKVPKLWGMWFQFSITLLLLAAFVIFAN